MNSSKRYWIIVALLIIVGIISLNLYFQQIKPVQKLDLSKFPSEIAGWSAKDIPLDEHTYQILETRDVILREYTKGSQKIILYIIVSLDNRKVSHPPEVCYIGSGLEVVEKNKEQIFYGSANTSKLTADKLLLKKKEAKEMVLYWYKAGEQFMDSYYSQQIKIAINQLRFKRISGALIRVSMPVIVGEKETLDQLKSFSQTLTPLILKYVP